MRDARRLTHLAIGLFAVQVLAFVSVAVVAERDRVPAGFVTCKLDGGAGNIGLIAVDV